jgi:hypothetical protein
LLYVEKETVKVNGTNVLALCSGPWQSQSLLGLGFVPKFRSRSPGCVASGFRIPWVREVGKSDLYLRNKDWLWNMLGISQN